LVKRGESLLLRAATGVDKFLAWKAPRFLYIDMEKALADLKKG